MEKLLFILIKTRGLFILSRFQLAFSALLLPFRILLLLSVAVVVVGFV